MQKEDRAQKMWGAWARNLSVQVCDLRDVTFQLQGEHFKMFARSSLHFRPIVVFDAGWLGESVKA